MRCATAGIAPRRCPENSGNDTALPVSLRTRCPASRLRIWEVTQRDEWGRSSFSPQPSTPASKPRNPRCPWRRAPHLPRAVEMGQDRGADHVNIDDGWIPVKKYIEEDLEMNTEREQAYWDERDEPALRRIIQHRLQQRNCMLTRAAALMSAQVLICHVPA